VYFASFDFAAEGVVAVSVRGGVETIARRHHKKCKTCLSWVPRRAQLYGIFGNIVVSEAVVAEVAAARSTPLNEASQAQRHIPPA
jgi:hypothetical protein